MALKLLPYGYSGFTLLIVAFQFLAQSSSHEKIVKYFTLLNYSFDFLKYPNWRPSLYLPTHA